MKTNKKYEDIKVAILYKERHYEIIEKLQKKGVRVFCLPDGDVLGSIMAVSFESDIDILYGIGGAPEGIVSAAAVRALEGNMQARLLLRKDVKFDRFTIFDRYIYDFIVDPKRSRINLPTWLRKLYVKFTPQPKIVFYLHADPDVIFKRKQELTLEEIKRQNEIYLNLAKSHPRFKTLDANRHYNESVNEALEIILNEFCEKL